VEVFRGPQTTLQGRNSIAGAIIVETKDPTFDYEADARAIAGNFDTQQFSGVVSGPLVKDQRAFRLSVDRRNARDNALSIWMENFNPDQRYATDFDDLAFFTAQYERLMAHWRAVLPLPMLEVQYEDTVADVEAQARRLMTFLDVPWDARCLDFYKSQRAVQTPSRWQVRQPIYTRSVGRWQAYADHLPALVTAFTGLCSSLSDDTIV
jgi:hypothetical protein